MTLPRHGYPIGALFVLVTLCAVLLAGIAPLVRPGQIEDTDVTTSAFLVAMGFGALSGITVGMVLGLLQFRVGLGFVMGAGVGAVIGTVGGALALLSYQQIAAAAAAMTAGSGLIVGVAVLMRRGS
jgi:hypothetical protein